MANIISIDQLFQTGRVTQPDPNQAATILRYSSVLAAEEYQFGFSTAQGATNTFGILRSMYVDNSENNYEIDIRIEATGYTFSAPANSTGWYNVVSQESSNVIATSAGASSGPVLILFSNINFPPVVFYKYGVTQVGVTVPNGADVAMGSTTDLAVTNPAANATLISITKGVLTYLQTIASYFGANSVRRLNGAGATVVKAAVGTLKRVNINTGPAASTVTISDSGGTLAIIDSATVRGTVEFDIPTATNLTVTIVGAADVTVVYK